MTGPDGAERHTVTDADTAAAVGSGDVPVLATPRLIAWMEAATVRSAAPFLDAAQTSVGTAVRVEHRLPTPVGDHVEVVAVPPAAAAGRSLTFAVRATDGSGRVVGEGEIDRAIVDRDRFLRGTARPDSGR
ncbi:thioesterase [Pseudonocardia sp. C8]|uniref:thioesterase family protein n=1 Tax=Pseudonocardia sp. C8 TaxID=2762759 RepID=UPI0016431C7C|nr:thioesterase [Pseudonocardia sp. C8]MBC3191911.1 thioesterase [Pseudonocardia sp. C8]